MNIYFSSSNNGFYNEDINGDSIPEDCVKITEGEWVLLMEGQSNGKVISSDEKGWPILVNPPELTQEQLMTEAENNKNNLLDIAAREIAPLQDAVDLEDATNEEVSKLKEWRQYRVALNRIDLSSAPAIEWPKTSY
ncbi:TPA: tail fiber assembly protein [Escherichia coli]|nr:tail fiber assembly protein [Escherichia coli]